MSKTFNENLEWFSGYICRDNEASRNLTVLNRINALKASHEEELEAAMSKFPFVEYDVAGNARHKAACALRELGDEQLELKPLYESVRALYEALNNEYPSDEISMACVLKTIRDRLIVLLDS